MERDDIILFIFQKYYYISCFMYKGDYWEVRMEVVRLLY